MKAVTNELSYEFKKLIGSGSSGTKVYEGLFKGNRVAVKKMDENYEEYIKREVSMLTMLGDKHENIVNYFCTETMDEYFFIALEICDLDCSKYFHSNNDQLRKEIPVISVLRQTTEGIQFLHDNNIRKLQQK